MVKLRNSIESCGLFREINLDDISDLNELRSRQSVSTLQDMRLLRSAFLWPYQGYLGGQLEFLPVYR